VIEAAAEPEADGTGEAGGSEAAAPDAGDGAEAGTEA
jgi:hypothetical protein